MHFGDTIFIFCLALIIFGPKKLPEIGRQIGKLMVEFRRASNEFKMQIEEELRASEEAERQKEINAKTTMLPSAAAAATVPALESVASGPVIAPPSTGAPVDYAASGAADRKVNGEFATAGTCSYEAIPQRVETPAYPEQTEGFNPGLNTASNGAIAEIPANETPANEGENPTVTAESPAVANGHNAKPINTETAVHHG
jgi:TatA/E family protein of Tat protein translocase